MKNRSAGIFFDKFAVNFDSFYEGKRNYFMQFFDRKFRRDIFERFYLTFTHMENLTERSLLDIGCGSGIYMSEALKRGVKFVTGIDPARGMLALADYKLNSFKKFSNRYTLLEGYFPDVKPTRHDYVIAMGVMDYIDDPIDFMLGIKDSIAINAFISFPSRHWLRTPIRQLRYKWRGCPVYFYDENKIFSLAKKVGLNVKKIIKIHGSGLDYFVVFTNL